MHPDVATQSTTSAYFWQLPKQHFSGNPLDRAYDARRKFDGTSKQEEVSLVVVAGREVCVREALDTDAGRGSGSNITGSLTGAKYDLQALLLGANDPELDLNSDSICLNWVQGTTLHQLPLYLLGQDQSERWTFALDVSEAKLPFLEFLRESCGLGPAVSVQDLRALMPGLSRDACAIAGQAVALSQWHQTHRFCPRCGGPTAPIETGLRRMCTADTHHKLYPRTDPVVIMLVESPDGRRALLGRSKKFTPGMYTCLSGFIDQCESIEEAVRREVAEEARVAVGEVAVVGSQPWPIGRYGSCELMLGCVAKARSYEIFINDQEMEDVQWYDKDELRAAVAVYDAAQSAAAPGEEGDGASTAGASVAYLQELSLEQLGFFVPPPLAIAHHLIRSWALHEGPWFPEVKTQAQQAAAAGAAAAAAGGAQLGLATISTRLANGSGSTSTSGQQQWQQQQEHQQQHYQQLGHSPPQSVAAQDGSPLAARQFSQPHHHLQQQQVTGKL